MIKKGIVMLLVLIGCTSPSSDSANHDIKINYCTSALEQKNISEIDNSDSALPFLSNDPFLVSEGDVLEVNINDDKRLSQQYIVSNDGRLHLPWVGTLPVAGLSLSQIQQRIIDRYDQQGMLRAAHTKVMIRVVKFAPVSVKIMGAVFRPGVLVINQNSAIQEAYSHMEVEHSAGKFLSHALKLAGGVRPNADLSHLILHRKNKRYPINFEGVFSAAPYADFPLNNGDVVEVPDFGCINPHYIALSKVTPVGVDIAVSNLAQSSVSSPVDEKTTQMPYGSRLLDIAFNVNCMGGSKMTTANRDILLISSIEGKNNLIPLKISSDRLLAESNNITLNPYLMDGDRFACFDAPVVNYREGLKLITETLWPMAILHGLVGW